MKTNTLEDGTEIMFDISMGISRYVAHRTPSKRICVAIVQGNNAVNVSANNMACLVEILTNAGAYKEVPNP